MSERSDGGFDRRKALHVLGANAAAWLGTACGTTSRKSEGTAMPATSAPIVRAIPSTGETVPVIGLGTWETFDVGAQKDDRAPLADVLREFVAQGGRVVDSSPMYGRSEAVVGELASELGVLERLFVATKVWTSGKDAGIAQMQASMKKLRRARIDLMQVHNLVDAATHLETLRAWKSEQLVRYIGVTHYTESAHAAVERVLGSQVIDFVQINYSAGEREAESTVLPLARERGVAVIANRPFGGGMLLQRLRGAPLPQWAGEIDCDAWSQVLLKFVVSHPAITCAIPATSKVAHVRENMQACFGRLPDEELREKIATWIA
ncbi:MAG: aldo/keto reductase [Planctomycetota bacterium]